MKLFDEKFRNNKLSYIFQCYLAALSVFVILLVFDKISNVGVIAALGSSTFIVFTMPKAQVTKPSL